MGIRDTSYYGWSTFVNYSENLTGYIGSASFQDICFDSSGSLYVLGNVFFTGSDSAAPKVYKTFVAKVDKDNGSISQVFASESISTFMRSYALGITSNDRFFVQGAHSAVNTTFIMSSSDRCRSWGRQTFFPIATGDTAGIASYLVDGNNEPDETEVYVAVGGYVFRSTDTGLTWASGQPQGSSPDGPYGADIIVASNGTIYYCGDDGSIRKSTTQAASWVNITPANIGSPANFYGICKNSSNVIYACGMGPSYLDNEYIVFSSSDAGVTWGSGTFGDYDNVDDFRRGIATTINIDSKGSVYAFGVCGTGSVQGVQNNRWMTINYSKPYGQNYVEMFSGSTPLRSAVDTDDTFYVCGFAGNTGIIRRGKLTANSASIGPTSFAASVGYVRGELSGTVQEGFKLMNTSEFSHAGGIFQMKNLVLGTTDSGKMGKGTDSIVQVRHRGSVVKVLWPKQSLGSDEYVKGYGDFSVGQQAGKLNTEYQPGDFLDVTKFDHLSLYCYAKVESSGTLDDIVIRVERRPLGDLPFTVDQTVTYAESGSFATEGILKDLVFRKTIDYGDLSMRDIGFPIDVPLENTREVRVSCRHKSGQTLDENKNFIVWGRFIKSSEET